MTMTRQTIPVTLDARDAQLLWVNGARGFLHEQWDRFEHDHPELMAADDSTSSMFWCETSVAALLLRSWYQALGHAAYVILDTAAEGDSHTVYVEALDLAAEVR